MNTHSNFVPEPYKAKDFLSNPPVGAYPTYFVPAANLPTGEIFTQLVDKPSNFVSSGQNPDWQFDISNETFTSKVSDNHFAPKDNQAKSFSFTGTGTMASSKNDNRGGGIMPPPKTSVPLQGYYMPNIPTVGGYSKEDDGMFHPNSTDAHVPVFKPDTYVKIFHPKTDDPIFVPKKGEIKPHNVTKPKKNEPIIKYPKVDTGGGIIAPKDKPIVVVDPIVDNKSVVNPIVPPAPSPSVGGGTSTGDSGGSPNISPMPSQSSKKDYSWIALVAAAGIFGLVIFKK